MSVASQYYFYLLTSTSVSTLTTFNISRPGHICLNLHLYFQLVSPVPIAPHQHTKLLLYTTASTLYLHNFQNSPPILIDLHHTLTFTRLLSGLVALHKVTLISTTAITTLTLSPSLSVSILSNLPSYHYLMCNLFG